MKRSVGPTEEPAAKKSKSGEEATKLPTTDAADADDSDIDISGLSDSDDDGGPLKAKGFMAALQAADMSDDESSSSSSSDEEPPEAEKKPDETTEKTADEKTMETTAPAADSDSDDDSDSSSSSSSSSESSDEEEGFAPDEALMPKAEEDTEAKLVESAAQQRRNELGVVRDVHLKRDEVIKMLTTLPEEVSERGIVHSFLRLKLAVDPRKLGGADVNDGKCIFAECVGVERCQAYSVTLADGQSVTVDFTLKCKRGSSTRPFKICHISNQDVPNEEYDQWKTYMGKLGMDPEYNLARMKSQLENIKAARHYVFTEEAVSAILKKRPNMEFEAQKESRMKSLVQAAVSQMDITAFRDNDVEEVVEKYNTTLRNIQLVEENTFAVQSDWFDSRSNLYSLKEINLKNQGRQAARDHHALMYTYAQEAEAVQVLNPFQRRDCRPLCAWDTKLTTDEALGAPQLLSKAKPAEEPAAQPAAKDAAKGSAPASSSAAAPSEPGAAAEGSSSSGAAKEQPKVSALDAMIKAHRKCNLLAKLNLRK